MTLQTTDAERLVGAWLRPQGRGLASLGELVCLGTRKGTERKGNQDRTLVVRFGDAHSGEAALSILCDGMGGMTDGGTCAEIASASLAFSVVGHLLSGRPSSFALSEATQHANRRVFEVFGGRGGTTLIAVLQHRSTVMACCVGDSRLLHVREDGETRQLSRDDTVKGALAAIGQVPIEGSPEHDRLVQFVGMGQDLQPHVFSVGDLALCRFLLLATDGAYRLAGDALANVARHATSPKHVVERVLTIADWVGGADDATMIAIAGRSLRDAFNDESGNVIRFWGPGQQQLVMIRPEVERSRSPIPPQVNARPQPSNPARAKQPKGRKQRRQQETLPALRELVINVGKSGRPSKVPTSSTKRNRDPDPPQKDPTGDDDK